MRINPILYQNLYTYKQNKNTQNKNVNRVSDKNINFKNSYEKYFNKVLYNIDFKNNWSTIDLIYITLLMYAKNISNAKLSHIDFFTDSLSETLHNIKSFRLNDKLDIIKSPKYKNSILTMEDREFTFYNPLDEGSYIRFNIDGSNNTIIEKFGKNLNEIYEFYPANIDTDFNHNMKKYSYMRHDGSYSHTYYNKDGSKNFWKNFLFSD